MQIKVKSLLGDEYIVEVQNDQLVSELKASISEKANGLAIEKQKLVFKGRTMQDTSSIGHYNLEEGCKVHLILQKETSLTNANTATSTATISSDSQTSCTAGQQTDGASRLESTNDISSKDVNCGKSDHPTRSRFELMLREKLYGHFSAADVERIMGHLQKEILADINSSTLDDLERLAKQKLNISNE